MAELIRHAVRARLRATLIWAISVGLVAGATLATFSAFDAEQMQQMVDAMPKDMLKAFGTDPAAYSQPAGYLGTELGSYLPAVIGFFMITGAAHAIAGAEHDGSLDVVLSQPVPRWRVPVASFAAGTIGMVVIATGYAVLLSLCSAVSGVTLSATAIVDSAVALVPISMAFGGLAMLLSAALRRPGAVTGTTGAIVVVTYVANTVALLVDSLSWMRWLSPFHYYGAPLQHGLVATDILVLLGIAGAFVAASVPVFARRDIRA